MICVIWFENCTSYCSLNLACSASGSSPFHKKAERKLRVLNCKPSPFLLFLCSSVLNTHHVPFVLLSLIYTLALLFFCSYVLKNNLSPLFSCLNQSSPINFSYLKTNFFTP